MITWKNIEQEQQELCKRLNLVWTPVDTELMIAVNNSLYTDIQPINGLRHPKEQVIDGWYLWSGDEIPQDDDQFFQPIHAIHLIDKMPLVLKYLGLPYGYRFLIDKNGFEDVWFDETILHI